MAEPKSDNKSPPKNADTKTAESNAGNTSNGGNTSSAVTAPVDELSAARGRVAELERAVALRDEQLDAARARVTELERTVTEREDELVAVHREHARREQGFDEALAKARRAPAERRAGEVERMRARHTLYFVGNEGPRKVIAGREFDASHEELVRAELVEGRDFERLGG
jgi:hypothetical protein